jgi:DNA-binding NarL/FixJ family response regulator
MRVMVADDQSDVRSALRLMLEEKPGISLVSEAGSSQDLIMRVKADCPDLVLMDWELPGTRGDELLKTLKKVCPGVKVIALSSRPQMRRTALECGADKFVCKSDPPETLLSAIDHV